MSINLFDEPKVCMHRKEDRRLQLILVLVMVRLKIERDVQRHFERAKT
jgi:hypothetical protein